MQAEIEVKFCNVDIEDIRARLKHAGATLEQPLRLMRRALIEEPQHKAEHAFLRIRDEGDKTTLTFKRRDDPHGSTIDSVKEIEVIVSDFGTTVELFKEAGWSYTTFQESRRETWQLGEAEIVIDQWPWLNTYIEIEAPTEEIVKETAHALGLDWEEVVYGSVDVVYAMQYEFQDGVRGVIDLPEVRFDDPLPLQFKER